MNSSARDLPTGNSSPSAVSKPLLHLRGSLPQVIKKHMELPQRLHFHLNLPLHVKHFTGSSSISQDRLGYAAVTKLSNGFCLVHSTSTAGLVSAPGQRPYYGKAFSTYASRTEETEEKRTWKVS